MTSRPDHAITAPPLRRSPLFWLGLFVAVSLGFEWWHSRQQYSGVSSVGSRDSSTTIYSAESALRLRSIAVNGNWVTWRRGGFFNREASSRKRYLLGTPMALGDPEAFPGKAWELSEGMAMYFTDPEDGTEIYEPAFFGYACYRFDYVWAYEPKFSSPTDRYDRLDIVAPYWFILSLYLPSWLGLMVWRRRRYFRRWDQVEGSVGTLSGEPAGSASQASTS